MGVQSSPFLTSHTSTLHADRGFENVPERLQPARNLYVLDPSALVCDLQWPFTDISTYIFRKRK